MTYKEQINKDLVAAMKTKQASAKDGSFSEKNELLLTTLRSILAAISEAETSGKTRAELSEADLEALFKSLVKKRRAAAAEYQEHGHASRAKQEFAEADIIARYVPADLDEKATRALITSIAQENGFTQRKDFGALMGRIKAHGNVDMQLASKIVKDTLTD